MKLNSLLSFVFILMLGCSGQEKGEIHFSEKEYFNDGTPGTGFNFLRILISDSIYSPSKAYSIIIPDSFKGRNIAWGSDYFTGMKKNTTKPSVFFLISNYDTTETQVVFDKNGNLDFTDDSIYVIEPGKWFKISMVNHYENAGQFVTRWLFRRDVPDSLYGWLHKGMTSRWKNALPSKYIMFDKRNNFRRVLLPDSNVVTLYDFNVNGFYNDKEDKIIAGDILKNSHLTKYRTRTKESRKDVLLPFKNNTYKVISIDKFGNNVELLALNKILDTTEILDDFRFIDEIGVNRRFEVTAETELTVLYFWGNWCVGCHVQGPSFVKLINQYSGEVQFYKFNSGDKEEDMLKYIKSKNYPFQKYRIDQKGTKKLYVEAYPSYLIVDKNKRILLRSSDINEVNQFLIKNSR